MLRAAPSPPAPVPSTRLLHDTNGRQGGKTIVRAAHNSHMGSNFTGQPCLKTKHCRCGYLEGNRLHTMPVSLPSRIDTKSTSQKFPYNLTGHEHNMGSRTARRRHFAEHRLRTMSRRWLAGTEHNHRPGIRLNHQSGIAQGRQAVHREADKHSAHSAEITPGRFRGSQ